MSPSANRAAIRLAILASALACMAVPVACEADPESRQEYTEYGLRDISSDVSDLKHYYSPYGSGNFPSVVAPPRIVPGAIDPLNVGTVGAAPVENFRAPPDTPRKKGKGKGKGKG